jgi:2-keto-4-pentenoate hydratase
MKTAACALFATLIAGCFPTGADAAGPDLDYMARLMTEAAEGHRPYPDLARVNPALDLDTLYDVQARYVRARLDRGERIGGFKGGFIPQHPIGGVLFAGGLRERPAEVRRRDFHSLLVEAEIAFELCAPVRAPLADVAALKAVVCRLRPAVELPDAALHDLAALRQDLPRLARALVPNDIATREVALGAAVDAATLDLAAVAVAVSHDDAVLGERAAGPANEALWEAVRWVVNEFALARGYAVEAGQIVMPGNLTGLHPGAAGRWRIDYGALGSVEFRVVD